MSDSPVRVNRTTLLIDRVANAVTVSKFVSGTLIFTKINTVKNAIDLILMLEHREWGAMQYRYRENVNLFLASRTTLHILPVEELINSAWRETI